MPHPVDDITELVNVRLYIRQEWTKDKVVLSQVWPTGDRTINGRPIPLGYARVTIDRILDKKFNKIPIEYPVVEGRSKLGQNKGSQVAWRKRFTKLDHQLSSDDENNYESSPTHDDHSPSPNRDHSPPIPCYHPREDRGLLSSLSNSILISPKKREDSSSSSTLAQNKIKDILIVIEKVLGFGR